MEPTDDKRTYEILARMDRLGDVLERVAAQRIENTSTQTIDAGKAANWITAAAAMFIAGACIAALIIGGIVALGYSQLVNTRLASHEQAASDAKTEFLAYKTRWDAERTKLQQQITELQHEKPK